MAGLSNFITNTATQSTTMPSWYDTAQQNVVNQATTGAGNVPALQNTVAGQAINQLSSPATNPFTQAQGTLGQIASGAANPWITSPTGQVTPNTGTALGGLFQAQNQQLQQLMPNIQAQPTATGIGSGQFGSLRTQTAADKAMADAQSKLFADQMQAALQNQQTGVQAATGQGAVGSQGVTSMTNLGQAQQADPLLAASALGKIVGGINAPTTVTNATQLSPLNQIGSIASALGGSVAGTNTLLKNLGIQGGLSEFYKKVIGGGSNPAAGSDTSGGYGTGQGGAGLTPNPDGTFTNQNGDILDANGKVISTGSGPNYNAGSDTNNQPIPDYTGPAIDNNPTNNAGPADLTDPGYSSPY